MNGRSISRIAALVIAVLTVMLASCSKDDEVMHYRYSVHTVSAVGLDREDEELLQFEVDSLNSEYHRWDVYGKGTDELTIKTFELCRDRFDRDIQRNIFDRIQAEILVMSVGVYHAEDAKETSPISEMTFTK